MVKNESDLVRNLVKQINDTPGCYAIRTNTGAFGRAGTPDIIACIQGRMLVIEAKMGRNQPTPAQKHQLARWHGASALTVVLHDYNAHELGQILQQQLLLG